MRCVPNSTLVSARHRAAMPITLEQMTALSPFRRKTEWAYRKSYDRGALTTPRPRSSASTASSPSRCVAPRPQRLAPLYALESRWIDRPGGLTYQVEQTAFPHHMVRFLVGTMLDIAGGRRAGTAMTELLGAATNDQVSPPAPAHALVLERVVYPATLHLDPA